MRAITVRTLKTKMHPETKRLFWFLFAGSKGGSTRIRIVSSLRNSPKNANHLARELGLDYKGVQNHLRKLENNNLVTKIGSDYGTTYFVSQLFEEGQLVFDEIVTKLKEEYR